MKKTKPAGSATGTRKQAGKAATPRKRAVTPAQGARKARRAPAADGGGRADSKQAQLIAMVKADSGATVEEIARAFGWQNHTVRGAIAGALKKRLGLAVTSQKVEGRGRVYRIGS